MNNFQRIIFHYNDFSISFFHLVFDNYTVTVEVEDYPYSLGLFDTAGQDDYDRKGLNKTWIGIMFISYGSYGMIQKQWIRKNPFLVKTRVRIFVCGANCRESALRIQYYTVCGIHWRFVQTIKTSTIILQPNRCFYFMFLNC